MPRDAQRLIALFAVFNLIAVPIGGSATWAVMQELAAGGQRATAAGVATATAVLILAVNVLFTRKAETAGAPRVATAIMWLVTGLTFVLPIGFGMFSPLNLIAALVGR